MSDSNKPNSRRSFLVKSIALIPAAPALVACSPPPPTSANAGLATSSDASVSLGSYQPTYFNADEWAFIKAAVDRLIPADAEGPGALELNVPVFIDRQMDSGFGYASNWYRQGPFKPDAAALWGYQGSLNPRDLYRLTIAALNTHCTASEGKAFADLAPDRQEQILKDMESGALQVDAVAIKDFFTFLLQNTKEGYLADPLYGGNKDAAAWKMIGFPGARADFTDWVGKEKVYPFDPVTIHGK